MLSNQAAKAGQETADEHRCTQRGLRRSHRVWRAAGSEAPRRFRKQDHARNAVSPLRSAAALQIFVVPARSCRIAVQIRTAPTGFAFLLKSSLSVSICVHLWSNSASGFQCGGMTEFVRVCLGAAMEGMDLVPGLGRTFFTGLGASTLRSPRGNAGDSSQSARKCSSTAVNPK